LHRNRGFKSTALIGFITANEFCRATSVAGDTGDEVDPARALGDRPLIKAIKRDRLPAQSGC